MSFEWIDTFFNLSANMIAVGSALLGLFWIGWRRPSFLDSTLLRVSRAPTEEQRVKSNHHFEGSKDLVNLQISKRAAEAFSTHAEQDAYRREQFLAFLTLAGDRYLPVNQLEYDQMAERAIQNHPTDYAKQLQQVMLEVHKPVK